MRNNAIIKGMVLGLIGGLVGTIIMDIVIVGFFLLVGMPTDLIYSFIGDVANSFFLKLGIGFPSSILLGVFVHFLLGLGLGGIFGIAVTQVSTLRVETRKKGILLGILYIELASQPILVTAPLLVKMAAADILQWYGLSTAMHLIYGIVLGSIMSNKSGFAIFRKYR